MASFAVLLTVCLQSSILGICTLTMGTLSDCTAFSHFWRFSLPSDGIVYMLTGFSLYHEEDNAME